MKGKMVGHGDTIILNKNCRDTNNGGCNKTIIIIWKMLLERRFALAETIWSCLRGLICSYKRYNNIH